jgi:hypothetical protein
MAHATMNLRHNTILLAGEEAYRLILQKGFQYVLTVKYLPKHNG